MFEIMEKIRTNEETAQILRLELCDILMLDAVTKPELSYQHDTVDTVYHYTCLETLIKIIENQTLWASNINFLNDKTEFSHGVGLIKEIINEIRVNENELILNCIIEEIERIYKTDRYVICFSKKGDLLSQWRAYANFGKGVSIGFKQSRLESYMHGILNGSYILYNTDVQKQTIRYILQKGIEYFNAKEKYYDWGVYRYEQLAAVTIIEMLETIISCYKDASFSEEIEFRLERFIPYFRKSKEMVDIKFRSGSDRLIPYVEVPTEFLHHERKRKKDDPVFTFTVRQLPITEIIVGPQLDFENVSSALKLLLKKHNYDDVIIKKSCVTLR